MFAVPEVRVGGPLRHANLTVFPLFGDRPTAADYLLAETALADGSAVVEEVTESGSVPQLSVTVTADKPVLFLEGQELRGAKQNRVLNATVLVAAKSKWVLPVSCVEQGRWRYAGKTFGSGGTYASAKMRKVLKASVKRSSDLGHGHRSDQGAVWAEVTRQMTATGSSSETMAMADCYAAHADHLADYQGNLPYTDGATGLAAAVGGVVVSVDLFDSPDTCKRVWPRILTGLAMDALEAAPSADDPDVAGALELFRNGPWAEAAAAGVGEEFRAASADDRHHGSALAHRGALIHGSMVFDPAPAAVGV